MQFPDTLIDDSDTSAFSADQLAVWNEMKSMYAGFLTGDRARTDAHMHPEITVWDTVVRDIADGLVDYNALRAARPTDPDQPRIATITCHQPIVSVWGDTAVMRHTLEADYVDDAAPHEFVRASSAWRRVGGDWMLVHSHEDVHLPEAS